MNAVGGHELERPAVDTDLQVAAVPALLGGDVVLEGQPRAEDRRTRQLDRRALQPHDAGDVTGSAVAVADLQVLAERRRAGTAGGERGCVCPVRARPAKNTPWLVSVHLRGRPRSPR